MKVKLKIAILNWLSYLFIIGMLAGVSLSTQSIDFKKSPIGGFVTLALAAIGASTIAYQIEKRLWNNYIKKLRQKYEQQRTAAINKDLADN